MPITKNKHITKNKLMQTWLKGAKVTTQKSDTQPATKMADYAESESEKEGAKVTTQKCDTQSATKMADYAESESEKDKDITINENVSLAQDSDDIERALKEAISRKRARHNTGAQVDDTILGNLNDILVNMDVMRSENGETSAQVESLTQDNVGMAKQIELLTNIVIKQDKIINHLQNGVIDVQKRAMQNNVIIHNAHEINDENCRQVAVNAINSKGIVVQSYKNSIKTSILCET